MALSAYRHLLRATRIAFQGDLRLLTSARHEARKGFETKRNLTPDDPQLATSIRHAEDVARILRQNIVQGQQVQGEQGENYKLRIHEDTERGDNDTIKLNPAGKPIAPGHCES